MREIKFRAYVPKLKKMGKVSEINWMTKTLLVATNRVVNNIYRLTQVKLMQYTGLKDVHGVEIYEGDIVNVSWPLSKLKGINHAIGYSEVKDGHPVSEAIDWYEDVSRLIQTHDNGGQITVVGNCFENPELLEEKK